MPATVHVPGAPNWLDLGTCDIDAAVAFYGDLLGWRHRPEGSEAGGYGVFLSGGRVVAGVGPLTEVGARPAWNVYFHTADADATARSVERAGGAVRLRPMDVHTFGRLATFTDPAGAPFGVWQPGRAAGLEAAAEPGALCRTELRTTDDTAALVFYRTVFGWHTARHPTTSATRHVLTPASGGGGGASGLALMRLPAAERAAGAAPAWHPYFGVSDCAATADRATAAGATLLAPPSGAPGAGRAALLRDPQGAPFALGPV
jgi:uncharacterized protein